MDPMFYVEYAIAMFGLLYRGTVITAAAHAIWIAILFVLLTLTWHMPRFVTEARAVLGIAIVISLYRMYQGVHSRYALDAKLARTHDNQ